MKWTDNDMLAFAEFCGRYAECGFYPKSGTWNIDDVEQYTTERLLAIFEKQQIPSLPSVNDLKNIKLGPESY